MLLKTIAENVKENPNNSNYLILVLCIIFFAGAFGFRLLSEDIAEIKDITKSNQASIRQIEIQQGILSTKVDLK